MTDSRPTRPAPRIGRSTILLVLLGFLVGGLLGTWVSSAVAVRAGGYYSSEILQAGQATMGGCRPTVWLTTSCEASVTWDSGVREEVRVQSITTPSQQTIPVTQHQRLVYVSSFGRSEPVTLAQGVPYGQRTGLATAMIYLSASVSALVLGLGTAIVLGRRTRRKAGRLAQTSGTG